MVKATESSDMRAAPIQFRPGPLLNSWLVEYGSAWGYSLNETAKRLIALAACHLDVDFHELILPMVDKSGKRDYVAACAYIRTALENEEFVRRQTGKPLLTACERLHFIQQMVDDSRKGDMAADIVRSK